jgi:hypothetical protein
MSASEDQPIDGISTPSTFDFVTVTQPVDLSPQIRSGLGALARKINEMGRQPYSSASVEYDFDPITAQLRLSILTVPKPGLSLEEDQDRG